ncbi:hypothetical protein EJD96_14000 [Herbaspirillum seropedicae]|uniref:hypothetical protein n=1 Tax=Herbaspirillum seropedicae TaxID=964 RepID=UPI00111F06F9|nr:hypothetical protein [Herbaspirillum seropedicae]QDD65195.1 hypothetical protein EJD96_14000 [Herbaspirillum seropedicae]
MGLIQDFMLGRHLTQVCTIFEHVLAAGELPDPSEDGTTNPSLIFSHLDQTRQAQIRFRMPGHLKAFRQYSPVTITQELLKNLVIASRRGRSIRVTAYKLMLWYLVEEGVALDLDRLEAAQTFSY